MPADERLKKELSALIRNNASSIAIADKEKIVGHGSNLDMLPGTEIRLNQVDAVAAYMNTNIIEICNRNPYELRRMLKQALQTDD